MTRPVATITQIDNGYLVTTMSQNSRVVRGSMGQPEQQQEQNVTYCADYGEVCSALKEQFPPSIVG